MRQVSINEDGVETSRSAARFLGITEGALANWRSAGIGPAYFKYGKTKRAAVFYARKDLIAFRDKHRVTPKYEPAA